MITDDISEPGAWERELSMRPKIAPKIHPGWEATARECAQLYGRLFKSETESKVLRAENERKDGIIEDLRHFASHEGGCTTWWSAGPCDCGLAELLDVTK